ncbi:MAG TPA: T9SS type A sorting domain-containing protein [Draconibacterium sp.]|nr:T9SS type A sorting domain-containing protein [Draconibacterium sp.]
MKVIGLGLLCVLTHSIYSWAFGITPVSFNVFCSPFVSQSFQNNAVEPAAVNDTFQIAAACGIDIISGNLLDNDTYIPDSMWLSHIDFPSIGNFICGPSGNFTFSTDPDFRGEIRAPYRLSCINNPAIYSEAELIIFVDDDDDHDEVINRIDIDDDNDGILDIHEGDGLIDTDGDGLPDSRDIDSDNDGITDFAEWQTEGQCHALSLCDKNCDGWDDAFDPEQGGDYYIQTDTDMDGIPDFQDDDSDNDGISDFIEAYDELNNQEPEAILFNIDNDYDGLDDACDTTNCQLSRLNPMESNCLLPDHNLNHIRDWRDPNNYSIEIDPKYAKTTENELVVFPNPIVDICTINLPDGIDQNADPLSLKIFDMQGKLVYMKLLKRDKPTLSLAHLENGIYILRIKAGSKSMATKLYKSY